MNSDADVRNMKNENENENANDQENKTTETAPDILESEIAWVLIGSYFKNSHLKQLIKHQLESYNEFVSHQIENTIQMFNPVRICSEHDYIKEHNLFRLEIFINFENFAIHRPQVYENNGSTKIMFPQEARLRNFTYAGNMTVDLNIKYIVKNGEDYKNTIIYNKVIKRVYIGKLPIMLRSNICVLNQYNHLNSNITGECNMDPGGYFIINGSEKTCIGQERAAENQIYCFNIEKKSTKWQWIAEMKSIPDWKCISPKQINLMITSKNNGFGKSIYLQIPRLKNPIPLFIVFRAFNIIPDKSICDKILLDNSDKNNKKLLFGLKGSIVDANEYMSYDSAIKYIVSNVIYTPLNVDKETGIKRKNDFALEVINNDIFPHCKTNEQKIYMLGYMANKLLQTSLKMIEESDRDSYLNKRVDLTGPLINNLFRNYLNKIVKDMQKQIVREINNGSWKSNEKYENIINSTNIYKIIKSTTIENGIKRALATGDFGIKQTNSNKVGVAQVLNRLTYVSSLSHLRRVNTPIDKSGKLVPPRRLHNSSWGFLCPAECFDPETPILMWDGTSKRAADIKVGDELIDDNGNPTKIRSTCSGEKIMYDIIPDKNNFIRHRVTDNHILTLHIRQHKKIIHNNRKNSSERFIVKFFNRKELKITEKSFKSLIEAEKFVDKFIDDDTLDITIEEYLNLNKNTQKHLVLFKLDKINWGKKEIMMDPYLLGLWLGGGLSCGTGFALNYKTDLELLEYWEKWSENNGAIITKDKRLKYSIIAQDAHLCNQDEQTPLQNNLYIYNLINNKHIPNAYLTNDRETRLKVLAGLVDTDGYVRVNRTEIRIYQGPNNSRIIEDAHTLAMSLGFSCGVKEGRNHWTDQKSGNKKFSTYKELTISGSRLYEIPTLLPRKKIPEITNTMQILRKTEFKESLFKLEKVDIGEYVGWQLEDKRGRFILSDGLVVHNTPEGASVGIVKNLSYMTHITINSNSSGLYEYILPKIIQLDEFHDNPNDLYNKVKVFINGCWVGISTTPVELYENLKDKKYKGIINIYTSIIFDYKRKEIKVCNDAGRLTRPVVKVKNNHMIYDLENLINKKDTLNKLKNGTLEWNDLLYSGKINESIIEYIDSYEQNANMIAMDNDMLINARKHSNNGGNDANMVKDYIYHYTHCEIHPSTIFGILASCIPFPENNQSPRNTYQCLDINTPVMMKNQTYKLIKNIEIGDEVLTFDPVTMKSSYTKIINQYIRPTNKQMYNVITYSGKSFNATFDHKFMTYNGWNEVTNLNMNTDLLGIKHVLTEVSNDLYLENTVIMDKEKFTSILKDYINMSEIAIYISELENAHMLPLCSNDNRVYLLSRIFGFVLASGTLTYNADFETFVMQTVFHNTYSSELFEMDIDLLGIENIDCSRIIKKYNNSANNIWVMQYGGAIGSLFKTLGMIHGNKITQSSNDIPEWIMNGTELTRREFLSGIQGGNGGAISYRKIVCGRNDDTTHNTKRSHIYKYYCRPFVMMKYNEHTDSLIKMMQTISDMFKYFNINNKVFVKTNKQNINMVNVGIQIVNSKNNLVRCYDTIGYKYNIKKITHSGIIVEYLKYKNVLNDFINIIHDLQSFNSDKKLAEKCEAESLIDFKIFDVEEFVKKCKIINDCIFVPIKSKNAINMTVIADITTESENHSFVINDGIMTHNSAMGKQAIGVYVTNYDNRMDKTAYVLTYPMRPLVDTRLMNLIKLNNIPSGEQVIVAIASHTGYNQEDSILFNQGSIDRGLFLATIYHTEKDEDKKLHGNEEVRCKPDKNITKNMKFANYDKLTSQGIVPENTLLEDRDIIIGKSLPIKENKNDYTKTIKYSDESMIYRTHEETFVDKNFMECNGDGYNFCKVRLRNYRKPVIGDKFCYTPDHEILTNYGWVNVANVTKAHKIASLVDDTRLVYTEPIELMHYDCNEEVYEINSNQISLKVTKNHRMYVGNRNGQNFNIKSAEECYGKRYTYKKNCTAWGPDYNCNQCPKELKLNANKTAVTHFIICNNNNVIYELNIDLWIQFFGIWIAEGHVYSNTNTNSGYIEISAHKDRVKNVVDIICAKLNWKIHKTNDRKHINARYRIYDKHMVDYMLHHSVGAINKTLLNGVGI